MKRIVALVLALLLLLSLASVAVASVPFNISTDSTTIFQVGTSQFQRNGTTWFLDVDTRISNVTATHRAVTRVHHGANAASATWVYSGPSGTSHDYILNYFDGLTFRGRLDNRDSGWLEFHGDFYK